MTLQNGKGAAHGPILATGESAAERAWPAAGAAQALVFYDVTRLVAMRRSAIATGIDRIDLRFGQAVFREYGVRCFPVLKVGAKAFLVERTLARALLDGLDRTWFGGEPNDLRTAYALERAGLTRRIDGPLAHLIEGGARAPALRQAALHAANGLCRAGLFLWSRLCGGLRHSARTAIPRLLTAGVAGTYITCSHRGIALCPGLLPALADRCGLRTLAYIHDIIPLDYPEYTRPGKTETFAQFLAELANAGASFVANSRDTARRLEKRARAMNWTVGKVPVVYPGFEPAAAPARPDPHQGDSDIPYFVIVGTIEPRKNHLLLLQIWRDLVQSGTRPMPHLHVVGQRGWENENILDLLDRCDVLAPHLTEHRGLKDQDLRSLIRGACALLFPSFAEGFGLPIMEALPLGTPVIASDLPVFREIAGDAPLYLSPLDGAGWRQSILSLLGAQSTSALRAPVPLACSLTWAQSCEGFVASLALCNPPLPQLYRNQTSRDHGDPLQRSKQCAGPELARPISDRKRGWCAPPYRPQA